MNTFCLHMLPKHTTLVRSSRGDKRVTFPHYKLLSFFLARKSFRLSI